MKNVFFVFIWWIIKKECNYLFAMFDGVKYVLKFPYSIFSFINIHVNLVWLQGKQTNLIASVLHKIFASDQRNNDVICTSFGRSGWMQGCQFQGGD